MIKYFIRHYWRYLAMALAFSTITFLINSCEVKASTISDNMNVGMYLNVNGTNITTYNFSTAPFSGSGITGEATLIFNFTMYRETTGDGKSLHSIKQISVTTGLGNYICSFDNVVVDGQYDQMDGTARCDIRVTSTGITSLSVYLNGTDNRSELFLTSYYATLLSKNDAEYLEKLNYLSNLYTMTTQLTYIANSIDSGNTSQYNQLNTINNNIYSILQNIDTHWNTQQNQLTDIQNKLNEILQQNQVCNYIDKINGISNGYLNSSGEITGTNITSVKVTDYIKVTNKTKIKVIEVNNNETVRTCFYNINKANISCIQSNNMVLNQYLTIPSNAQYVRFTINVTNNKPQFEFCDTAQNIQNQQNEQIIQGQNDINNNITDSSTDDPSNDLTDMQEYEVSNSVISDLLLLPLNMFQNIVNAIGGTCSPFSLGALFGTTLTLPCINIENLLGSTLWGVIDILFCGIFVLSIRKKFVDIFENITSLKDRGNELE